MPYDENFYRAYREYLKEPTVRRNHDHVFALFSSLLLPELPRVVDCGCGVGEYAAHDCHHGAYVGVDRNKVIDSPHFIQADYLSLTFPLPFAPNAFVSLFSIECCHPLAVRYDFYERAFAAFPTIQCGLAGGFFYESRRGEETVVESGKLVSYQTIEDPSRHISPNFTELRAHFYTPSQMFGHDVVEVWKFFIREERNLGGGAKPACCFFTLAFRLRFGERSFRFLVAHNWHSGRRRTCSSRTGASG